MNLSQILSRVGKWSSDNSPAILTGLAVTGTIATAYLTGKATVKAVEIMTDYEWRPDDLSTHESTPKEVIGLVWKEYLPAVCTGVFSIACMIGANRIGNRRAAAVAAAYAISERAFEEYRNKVIEKFGEKKETSVRDDVAQDRVTKNPPLLDYVYEETGSVLCCDLFTGRYFLSDMETIRRAENTINYQVNNNYYASLSDFYEQLGLEKTSMSDDFGWNSDRLLETKISTTITPSGKPCLTLDFKVMPIRGYSRLQ